MLPQDGNEDKDGGNEDEGESDLRHWARGKWFDFSVGAVIIVLFVPAGKRSEKEEADERKDNGDDSRKGRQYSLRGKDNNKLKLTLNTETRYCP